MLRHACWLMLVGALGCGGSEPQPPSEAVPATSTVGGDSEGGRSTRPRVEVTGIMGTIPQRAINERFEMKQQTFLRCFFDGSENLEVLGGRIEFYFRIANDGSVRWVIPRQSDVGDRATERCLLNIAARMKFPPPQGGDEAEFSKPLEVESSSPRPPVAWEGSRVASSVVRQSASIRSCGPGAFTVTAYVAPGGSVLAAGVAIPDESGLDGLDCVATAVKTWTMPDPGSFPAKVTFSVE